MPAGFNPTSSPLLIDAGGVLARLPLSSKGSVSSGGYSFKVALKTKNGAILANPAAKFTASFGKGTFQDALAIGSKLTNGTFKKETRIVTFAIVFNGNAFRNKVTLHYTAKENRSGAAK